MSALAPSDGVRPRGTRHAEPAEPFAGFDRQREAARFGLWVFLASEALLFGALILCYAVYRFLYPAAFQQAGAETNVWLGTANTAILLTSSATMATAVRAGPEGLRRTVLAGLGLTAALGMAFLAVKGLEYREDIHEHLLPGSPLFPVRAPQAQVFFSFYWLLTGLHAVHLTVGIGAILVVARLVARGAVDWTRTGLLAGLGLYWHLIDVVWIVLYPLLYLVGRG